MFFKRVTQLCGCVVLLSVLPATATEIRLKARAASQGSLVLLGDVAKVSGADIEQLRRIRRVELFPAPSPGQVRVLRLHEVREFLKLNNFDTSGIRFVGSSSVRVSPRAHPRSPQKVVKTTPDTMTQYYVVATRPIAAGSRISSSDVSLEPQPERVRSTRGYIRDPNAVIGLEATRAVAVGMPLQVAHVREPILVRRREIVSVVSRATGVRVRTEARALDDGSLGSIVLLESLTNRERYTARVTGTRQTEVYEGVVAVPRQAVVPRRIHATPIAVPRKDP